MTVALKVQNIISAFEIFDAMYIVQLWLLSVFISKEQGRRGDGKAGPALEMGVVHKQPQMKAYMRPCLPLSLP